MISLIRRFDIVRLLRKRMDVVECSEGVVYMVIKINEFLVMLMIINGMFRE